MKKEKAKKIIEFIGIFIAVFFLALLAYSITNASKIDQNTSVMIQTYGIPAIFFLSIFLDLVPQYVSPVVALAAAIIAKLNIYYATTAIILGSAIGSFIGYTIGKKYVFKAVDIMASKKSVEKLTQLTNDYGKIIVPLAAVSPVPYLPVAIGAAKFSTRNFIIYGIIPRALSLAIYAYLFSFI